jgi:hypothetical protein
MYAEAVKASSMLASRLGNVISQVGIRFSRLKKSEVAEALIATWCVEFLRVRKVGGFNVVQIMIISFLMLGVKTVIMEASKRRHNGKSRTYVMSTRTSQMEPMEVRHNDSVRGYRRGNHVYRRRPPFGRDTN